jgi:hypothetical protein
VVPGSGKVCIRQTGNSIETKIKEHPQHIRLYYLEKSAVAEHSINMDHCILFHDTNIMAKKSGCMEHIIRKSTDTEFHPNMNREGFSLRKLWKPLIQTLKEGMNEVSL